VRIPPSSRALCALERRAGVKLGRSHWLVGRVSRPSVRTGHATRRVSWVKCFGAMARPQQAKRALCAWAELDFGPEGV
jgi:hypothetical protein